MAEGVILGFLPFLRSSLMKIKINTKIRMKTKDFSLQGRFFIL
jgi:hypothetical protein